MSWHRLYPLGLISLSIVSSGFLHLVPNDRISLFLSGNNEVQIHLSDSTLISFRHTLDP